MKTLLRNVLAAGVALWGAEAWGAEAAKLPRLVDLGADKCIPCKMMAPILADLKTNYVGRLEVEFIDVWKNPDAGKPYPFILKPDVGQRGAGVKLIRDEAQAIAYLKLTQAPLLLQRYAPGPHEVGVFYFRYPSEANGHIFVVTEKVFPTVTGDGRSTISELIWAEPRARFLAAKYLARLKGREHEVLPNGETLRLVEAGNHAQGCIFRDGATLCTPELAARINAISSKLPGFYIGRYDIRYSNKTDLAAGRNFQIVELNGAASEATSIYDARNSLRMAYRTLFRQWELVFAIGAENRRNGCESTPFLALWQKWCEYSRHAATYPAAD